MKSYNTRKTLVSAVGALFLMASVSYALPPDDDFGPGHGERKGQMEEHMKKMEKKLNLTPDQQTKLDEHRKAHRDEAKKLFEEMKQKREEMKAELDKPDLDETKVKAINENMKALRNKLADHRLTGILEVRKILSPEQFKKFQELTRVGWKKQGMGHMGKNHGREPSPQDASEK